MRTLSLAILGMLVAAGCVSETHQPGGNSGGGTVPANPTCRITTSDPFQCIATYCQQAGGQYNAKNQTCTCANGLNFRSWGKGTCETRVEFSDCLNRWQGFSRAFERDEKDFSACLRVASTENTKIFVSPPARLQKHEQALWSDANLQAIKQVAILQPELLQPFSLDLRIGANTLQTLSQPRLASLTDPMKAAIPYSDDGSGLIHVVNVLENDNIVEALTPRTRDGRIVLPTAAPTDPGLRRVHGTLLQIINADFIPNRPRFYTVDGCAGSCELFQDSQTSLGPVTRVRMYASSRLLADWIYLWEDNAKDRAYALVSLLPSGEISLIHTLTPQGSSSEGLMAKYQIWDKNYSSLLGSTGVRQIAVSKFEELKQVLDGSYSAASSEQKPQAVVCEAGFSADTLQQIGNQNWLHGPKTDESFFGWLRSGKALDADKANWGRTSFSGVAAFTDMGVSTPFYSFDEHARKVSKNVIGRDHGVRILPIGLSECAEEGDKWIPQVLGSSLARVVNFSAVESYSKESCADSSFAKQIKANEASLLYVVAAGNSGANGDVTPVAACPQSLTGQPNLIVVASLEGSWFSRLSNYGSRFADIAADGSHDEADTQTFTTSFAAPRVTALAAKLQQHFPGLSPQKIRQAILFSAYVPMRRIPYSFKWELNPMPVRSGGILDEARAWQVAALLATRPGLSVREVFENACTNRYTDANCDVIDARVELLRRNGVIQ